MLSKALAGQMQFLIEADKMKSIQRRTLLADGSRRENDAEHSWHIALMALVLAEYAPPGVQLDRVLRMALLHDIVEIDAGDTFAYDEAGKQSQAAREAAAADRLFSLLPAGQGGAFRALWEEFDAQQTPDALFAAAVDRLQPFVNNCLTNGHTWTEGHVTAAQVYERMEPVSRALPMLWPEIDRRIREAVASGLLRP